ncbi:MAG: hypothetical protein GF346_10230 [Candidatus Eisenbacteria bacterium]|nr:hypothetical protein [Candidatus Latescibacterota bacterium]MBD3302812.1 hypothetical protein [Candidatus Eisenbacteria bacterium]
MTSKGANCRYEMIHVQPGYVMVEHDLFSRAVRSYFTTDPIPPKEEYREGNRTWRSAGMGQSFRFDIRDAETGEVTSYRELLGLLYYASCEEGTGVHEIGRLAHENRISIYVAITYEDPDRRNSGLGHDKLRILNEAFNERLQSRDKKILILPDVFGLHRTMSYGQVMIDFGLTSMEGGE